MKNWNRWIVSFLCSFILLLSVLPHTVGAQEVSYDYIKQEIQAEVNSDGSMNFKDFQTYDVELMNGVYFKLDTQGSEVTDYRVGMVDPETKKISYFTEEYTDQPNTFQVNRQPDLMEFKVFHPTENKQVTFVYEYQMADMITNYKDTAVLNRKIIGAETDESFDASVQIILPGKVDKKEDFRAWAHGAPQGNIQLEIVNGRSAIKAEVPNNPANQFVEIHSIFPTALTPQNMNRVDENKKVDIIAQEEDQIKTDKADYKRSLLKKFVLFILASLLAPLTVLKGYHSYLSNRKKANPNPVHIPTHLYEIPEDITPAVMAAAVLRKDPNEDDFAATILDLARKGYIELEEIQKEKRGLFSNGISTTVRISPKAGAPDENKLMRHEVQALHYVQPDNRPITFEEIEDMMSNDEAFKKTQYGYWTQFVGFASVKGEQVAERAIKEQAASMGWNALALFGSIGGTIGVGFLGVDLHTSGFVPALILGALCIIAATILLLLNLLRPIRSAKEDSMAKEWNAFKQMLNDIGQFKMREIGELALWEEFLVYAVSLGVADKVVDAMNIEFKPEELSQGNLINSPMSDPYILTHTMRQSVGSSIEQATPVQTVSRSGYSGSNSGGFGGGFSGGSSGGFGGGSGSGGF